MFETWFVSGSFSIIPKQYLNETQVLVNVQREFPNPAQFGKTIQTSNQIERDEGLCPSWIIEVK